VQLEEAPQCTTPPHPAGFQFHIGAIRSRASAAAVEGSVEFQFHIGAIRSAAGQTAVATIVASFNSILVQLEAIRSERNNNQSDVSIPYWCN